MYTEFKLNSSLIQVVYRQNFKLIFSKLFYRKYKKLFFLVKFLRFVKNYEYTFSKIMSTSNTNTRNTHAPPAPHTYLRVRTYNIHTPTLLHTDLHFHSHLSHSPHIENCYNFITDKYFDYNLNLHTIHIIYALH